MSSQWVNVMGADWTQESLRALEGAENGNDALKVGKIYLGITAH